MKKMLFTMLVGAGLAYFFDPANGVARRESLSSKLGKSTPARPVPVAVVSNETPISNLAAAR